MTTGILVTLDFLLVLLQLNFSNKKLIRTKAEIKIVILNSIGVGVLFDKCIKKYDEMYVVTH
jgi:hypothetical protein